MGEKMEKVSIFAPLQKVDIEKREVWGVLVEERVDKSDEILDYESSKPLFLEWNKTFMEVTNGQSMGNLRSMHKAIAAGKFISMEYDDENKKVVVGAKVVDDEEWKKVVEGVYTGFSIGGKYLKKWYDSALNAMKYTAQPCEGSLVDNPCMYGATFTIVKADGLEEEGIFKGAEGEMEDIKKDAEVEKEVELEKEVIPEKEVEPEKDLEKADDSKKEEDVPPEKEEEETPPEKEEEEVPPAKEEEEKEEEGMEEDEAKKVISISADDLGKVVGDEVEKSFGAYKPQFEKLETGMAELSKSFGKMADDFEKMVTVSEELKKTVETLTTQNEELSERLKKVEDSPADSDIKLMAVEKGIGIGGTQKSEVEVLQNLIAKTDDLSAKQALSVHLATLAMKDVYKK
jgi:hypothetical protein